jgi:protein TonB
MEPIMSSSAAHRTYFDEFARRNWRTWFWSGLAAGAMNLLLFLLMPHLMDPAPTRSSLDPLIPQVHVIRLARQDTPVKRQAPKPPPKPKPVERPQMAPKRTVMTKLTLPFEINPRLPAGPNTLVLPDLESAPLMPSAGLPGAFDAGQLDGPLVVLARVPPLYPMRARRRGIEGWVKVSLIVDEDGHVGDIKIIAAEPSGVFEQSVRRCVSGWRFQPGTVEGMPVRAKVETTIRYTLE